MSLIQQGRYIYDRIMEFIHEFLNSIIPIWRVKVKPDWNRQEDVQCRCLSSWRERWPDCEGWQTCDSNETWKHLFWPAKLNIILNPLFCDRCFKRQISMRTQFFFSWGIMEESIQEEVCFPSLSIMSYPYIYLFPMFSQKDYTNVHTHIHSPCW